MCAEMQCHTNRCYLSSTFSQELLNPREQILKRFWKRKAEKICSFFEKKESGSRKIRLDFTHRGKVTSKSVAYVILQLNIRLIYIVNYVTLQHKGQWIVLLENAKSWNELSVDVQFPLLMDLQKRLSRLVRKVIINSYQLSLVVLTYDLLNCVN